MFPVVEIPSLAVEQVMVSGVKDHIELYSALLLFSHKV